MMVFLIGSLSKPGEILLLCLLMQKLMTGIWPPSLSQLLRNPLVTGRQKGKILKGLKELGTNLYLSSYLATEVVLRFIS